MKVINEKPPVWDKVCAAFGVLPQNVFFTYGDTIYNPDGAHIPDHILAHEEVHEVQQTKEGMTPELWWGKFLRDPQFRVDQEAEAYAKQYAFICNSIKDRNHRYRVLFDLARILSGPLYDKAITHQGAITLIKERAKKYNPRI